MISKKIITWLTMLLLLTTFVIASDVDYELWTVNNTQKVLLYDDPIVHAHPALKLNAARNEYEAGQLIISTNGDTLEDVTVSITPLKSAQGTEIGLDHITVAQQYYLDCRDTTNANTVPGWYPDALPPVNGSFTVDEYCNQGLWITVHVPKGTPAGIYTGTIDIKPANGQAKQVPVELEVWDFELTDESHLETAFAIWGDQVLHAHGLEAGTPEAQAMIEKYYWFQAEYRLPSNDIPVPITSKRADEFINNPKVYSFRAPYEGWMSDKEITENLDHIREKGWTKKAYFYWGSGIDEPTPESFELVKKACMHMEALGPDIRHVVTARPWSEIYGYVDTWCPPIYEFNPEEARARQKAGDRFWWYTFAAPQHPSPNFHIDGDAIEHRILWWMQKMFDDVIEGNLYWSTTIFKKWVGKYVDTDPWKDPRSFPNANGDGRLFYPGTKVGIDGPVPSIRLALIREGIEDYEYMWLLEQKTKEVQKKLGLENFDPKKRVNNTVSVLVANDRTFERNWDRDPEKLFARRKWVAEQILSIEESPLLLYDYQLSSNRKSVTFSGRVEKGAVLFVNEKKVVTDQQDDFSLTLPIKNGENEFLFRASLAGKEKIITETVVLR